MTTTKIQMNQNWWWPQKWDSFPLLAVNAPYSYRIKKRFILHCLRAHFALRVFELKKSCGGFSDSLDDDVKMAKLIAFGLEKTIS